VAASTLSTETPASPSSAKQSSQYLGLTHELRRGGAQDAPRVSVEVVRLVEGALMCVLQPKPVQLLPVLDPDDVEVAERGRAVAQCGHPLGVLRGCRVGRVLHGFLV